MIKIEIILLKTNGVLEFIEAKVLDFHVGRCIAKTLMKYSGDYLGYYIHETKRVK